eukprot:TRINITY_DN7592_c0_g1_i1.p1 TRINITY_DN7592_c0_g1~~TRINITY_DN7592_c0_g1_i1.p1  ORF type:complete len:499 (-),score=182.29 TRINITY_DN7592_c0_g1_i1:130-1626(-)
MKRETEDEDTQSVNSESQLEESLKRKVTYACVSCKRSHLSCDSARPCKRCVARNIGESCTDGERKKRGRKKAEDRDFIDEMVKGRTNKQQKQQTNVNNGGNSNESSPPLPHLSKTDLPASQLHNNPPNQISYQQNYVPIMTMMVPPPQHMIAPYQPNLTDSYARPYYNPFQPIGYPSPIPPNLSNGNNIHPPSNFHLPMALPLGFSNNSINTNNNVNNSQTSSTHSKENIEEMVDHLRTEFRVDSPFNLYSLPKSSKSNSSQKSNENWYNGADPYRIVDEVEEDNHLEETNRKAEERGWLGPSGDHSEVSRTAVMYRKKLREILDFVNPEQLKQMKGEYDIHLNNFKTSSAQMDVPSMIWERYGIVQHVNQAFVDLTGFSEKLPTKPERMLLLDTFLFPNFRQGETQEVNQQFFGNSEGNQVMIPAHVRIWENRKRFETVMMGKKKDEMFMEGTLCVTVKRDVLNLPILFYAHFLPSPSALMGKSQGQSQSVEQNTKS